MTLDESAQPERPIGEWIQDARYREMMESMITVADVGGPQELILGGAVVQLEDFERFIPRGMVQWFILEKWTRTATPEENEDDGSLPTEDEEATPPSSSMNGSMTDNVFARLQGAVGMLGDELFPPPRIVTPDAESP